MVPASELQAPLNSSFQSDATMQNIAVRHVPELDGLRGIAIISVLVHHQLTSFTLKGGFLGVDLFFVLSGFLITGLLVSEFDRNGSISMRNFYMRRVLRLGPALACFLLGCLLVSAYTREITIARQLKLIAIALLYSTNWRMAFGWDQVLDPTAIIWSLSIEEQFYLVWPLLLSVCLAIGIRRSFIIGGLAVAIAGILIHRNVLLNAGVDFTRLYYGSDTRADALLAGCLVALAPAVLFKPRLRRIFGVLGVLALVGFFYFMLVAEFADEWLYSGGLTAIAFLSAILIWVSANSPPKILSAFLQWFPLRWFGHISYGLYLWHWLIVRNTSLYYLGALEPWAKMAIAVAIAATSFYLIEKPFNNLKHKFSARPRPQPRSLSPRNPDEAVPSLVSASN
jgi:peptidoglycan/LPS O-acetylase OafA/YrhL